LNQTCIHFEFTKAKSARDTRSTGTANPRRRQRRRLQFTLNNTTK
jgi:hypothetical protein